MLRRTPLKRVSDRRRATLPGRRKCCAEVWRRAGGRCEIGTPACNSFEGWFEYHELLPRSAGGSITAPANVRLCCIWCHRYIHKNPAEAYRRGWLLSRYGEGGAE